MAKKDLVETLRQIESDLYKRSEDYRRLVSDTKVHVITLSKSDLKKQIKAEMLARGGFKTLPKNLSQVIDNGADVLFNYLKTALNPESFNASTRKAFYTSQYKATNAKLTVAIGVKEGKGTRSVFAYFRRIKQRAQKTLVQDLNKEIKKLNNSNGGRQTQIDEINPSQFIDVGHSGGSAVSLQRKAQVQKALFMFSSKGDSSVAPFIKSLAEDLDINIFKTPGKQKDHIEVTLESKSHNRGSDAQKLKKEAGNINEVILSLIDKLDVPNLKGSKSSIEHRVDVITNVFADYDKLPNVRSNVKKKKTKRTKASAGTNRKSKSSKGKAFKDSTAAGKIKFGGNESRKQSNITLFALLQNQLPRTVASNMGYPRLENRTGTFASSVQVTDVSQTRQGYPSVGYTYRKDPYQVFEASSGTRFSSVERDPRTIIDASIRQIAAQLVTTRLYTRRL